MSDLLPCPFCGGDAEVISAKSIHGGYLFGIICNICASRGDLHDTEDQAIDAWNSRAERTCERFWTGAEMICSACAYQLNDATANYCSNCGARVVSK